MPERRSTPCLKAYPVQSFYEVDFFHVIIASGHSSEAGHEARSW